MTSFIALGMRSKGNTLINGEPTVDNAPAHRSVLVNDFLANNNVTTLEHPPYPPYLVPGNFLLFPQLKSALKGRHFCDATDIKNATDS